MGIVSGAITAARFRVVGDLPKGWREIYRDRLNEHAFRVPPQGQGKEQIEGWVQVHNLLDTSFDVHDRWLYENVVWFALRVDTKRIPRKLFKATLDKKVEAWCAERGVQRAPASVRQELQDQLETQWLDRTLPTVQVTEAAWNLDRNWLLLHSLSEGVADRFRKRFFRTFGLKLLPWSPLDWLEEPSLVSGLMARAPAPAFGHDDVRLVSGVLAERELR
jgi:DNA recombination-dependent growth factor C